MTKKATDDLVSKASESLKAAEVLFREGFYDFSVSRAYYAMFYLAQAALLTKGLSFGKHSAVIAAFGREFAKAGVVDTRFHRNLKRAYDRRTVGDYGLGVHVSAEASQEAIDQAGEFYEAITRTLKTDRRDGT